MSNEITDKLNIDLSDDLEKFSQISADAVSHAFSYYQQGFIRLINQEKGEINFNEINQLAFNSIVLGIAGFCERYAENPDGLHDEIKKYAEKRKRSLN